MIGETIWRYQCKRQDMGLLGGGGGYQCLHWCDNVIIDVKTIHTDWHWLYNSRQNYTENRWRCIGRIWLGILKKYFAWKLCIMKVCYGLNISSVWKSSMRTILHGRLALNTRGIWKIMHMYPYNFTQWSEKQYEGISVNVRIWGFWGYRVSMFALMR